ncbi:hypothetical protein QVD17_36842 [Tagetes erecta]|uniref:Uncharacterized protein n=1 Tax=Tagetes erecta TaxID=13708 RepID=A0AAD8JX47_TARER|nr:hypothetical protein QVD17_36842 [Tagetes erecta]
MKKKKKKKKKIVLKMQRTAGVEGIERYGEKIVICHALPRHHFQLRDDVSCVVSTESFLDASQSSLWFRSSFTDERSYSIVMQERRRSVADGDESVSGSGDVGDG